MTEKGGLGSGSLVGPTVLCLLLFIAKEEKHVTLAAQVQNACGGVCPVCERGLWRGLLQGRAI
jgi:hypothetical protein